MKNGRMHKLDLKKLYLTQLYVLTIYRIHSSTKLQN